MKSFLEDSFKTACVNNQLEKIIDIFMHQDGKKIISLENIKMGFVFACQCGCVEVAKWIIQNLLPDEQDISMDNEAFIYAYEFKNNVVIDFLIYEKKIEKSLEIISHLQKNEDELTIKIFESRDIKEKLEKNMQKEKLLKNIVKKV